MTKTKENKINKIIKLAKKYYPHDRNDWSARHRALAFCAEALVQQRKEIIQTLKEEVKKYKCGKHKQLLKFIEKLQI